MQPFEAPTPIVPDHRFGIELQDKVRQEYKLFGQFQLKKGMIMWEIELATGEVRPCNIQRRVSIHAVTGRKVTESQAIYNPKCFYLAAINKTNAIRKYNKIVTKVLDDVAKRHQAG